MTRRNETTQAVTDGSDLVWQGETYARIPPGVYSGSCTSWQGPAWVRAFRRWSLRLNFILMDGETEVSGFLNLGDDPKRKSFGRRSKYYKVWCQANGEPPCKGQRMPPKTFTEPGLLYILRVDDATKDEHQAEKPEALVYSKAMEILRVERI
jgi:hypothetical protein